VVLAALRSVASLLLGAGILILGNSLLGILLPVRLGVEDVPPAITGLVMSAYYAGLVAGSLWGKTVITRVGHIRAFAAFAALLCAATLSHALWFDPAPWAALRFVSGFCMAALFATIESWLNERSGNEARGQVLSLYQWTAYLATGLGQLLVNLADVRALELYIVAALLLSLSLLPVVLTRVQGPDLSGIKPLSLKELYRISPLGVAGCFGAGIMSGAFFGMGPIYGQEIGLPVLQISLFMGAAILGGLILQWPIGRLSDRFDRRTILLLVLILTAAAFGAMYFFSAVGVDSMIFLLGMPVLFGGTMSTIYPIAVSHAFDYVSRDRMVAASSGLLLAWAVGSTIGPFATSLLMNWFGSPMLFLFLAVMTAMLAVFARYRMSRRAALPASEQATFVPLTPTGDVAGSLDPRQEKGANFGYAPRASAAGG